jgi:uncharacterized protein
VSRPARVRSSRRARKTAVIVLVVVGSLALGMAVANRFAGPLPPRRLVMSTGRPDGAYHEFALQYRQALAEQGFTLEVLPGPGSLETLARLAGGQADVGFVQGGTAAAASTAGLTALGSVFYEPLWVLLGGRGDPSSLAELKGRRVAVGEPGSGTRALGLQLLADSGVSAANTTLLELPTGAIRSAFAARELDAALVVASARAPLVHQLLETPGIEVMSERRDLAYRSRYPFLTSVRVGEGMIDVARNVPRRDKVLLASAASLVVREGIHPDSVRLLLLAAGRVHLAPDPTDPSARFPSDRGVELPLHDEAIRYLRSGPSWLERRVPFWLAGLLDRTLLVLLPVFTLLFPFFGWILPMLDRRHRSRIAHWYRALDEAERRCASPVRAVVEGEIARLRGIQHEVAELRDTPLLHLGELYALRMHVDLAIERLARRRAELEAHPAQRHSA